MPAPHRFLQAGRPSCCPTNSVKALKAEAMKAVSNYEQPIKFSKIKAKRKLTINYSLDI